MDEAGEVMEESTLYDCISVLSVEGGQDYTDYWTAL